jgi:hypothetical protein
MNAIRRLAYKNLIRSHIEDALAISAALNEEVVTAYEASDNDYNALEDVMQADEIEHIFEKLASDCDDEWFTSDERDRYLFWEELKRETAALRCEFADSDRGEVIEKYGTPEEMAQTQERQAFQTEAIRSGVAQSTGNH